MRQHVLHKLLYSALFISFFVSMAVLSAPVDAAAIKISGAEATVFDQATNSFIFTGPVTITDGKTTITGEYVAYNGASEVLQFRGPVSIIQDDNTIRGYDLVYDIKNSTGSMQNTLSTLSSSAAQSPVFVTGDQVNTCKERTVLNGAKFTTCDPENPGYYLASRTIEIYPGDKMVLYGVRFVESKMTLFYWPKLTLSLKGDDPTQAAESILLPRIGYSDKEGWFIKSSYGYRGPGQQRGRILLDYMQLLGWGYGIEHTLRSDANGSEKVLAYAQPNRKTDHTDLQFRFDEQRTLPGKIQLTGSSAYTTSYTTGEQRDWENQLTLTQDRTGGSTSISYKDIRLNGPETGYEILGNAYHTQDMGDGWKLRLNASTNKRARPDATDRNLVGYVAEVNKSTKDWTFGVVAEDRFNPDLDDDDTPSEEITWNKAQRLPEVTMRLNRLTLAGWETPFALDAAWGNLAESRQANGQRFSTERLHVSGSIKPLQLDLGAFGRVQWSGAATHRTYSTGSSHWILGADSQYQLPVTQALSLTGNYRYEQAFGDPSPFYFDRVDDQEEVEIRTDFNTSALQLSLSGGYDLLAAAPLDIVGSIMLQPTKSLKLQAQGAYSPVDSSWLYLAGTGQYKPSERFSLNLGAKYDMQLQRADRIDALLNWDLGSWEVGYSGIYDGIDDEFDLGDFRITRDLGCRAIDLRYNQGRKEVWLEYRITAFPSASVKLGATDQNFMFDARGWEEVLAED